MKPKPIRMISRAAMMLLMMVLTATTAGAQEAISGLTYNSTGGYYEINDKQDLIDLATYVNAGHNASGKWFKQTADINMSGVTWTAIGTNVSNYEFRRFYGNYDGNCKKISNLTYSGSGVGGLFGYVGNSSGSTANSLKNIRLVNCSITSTGGNAAGIVVNATKCNIENCEVTGTIDAHSYYAGGIVADMSGGSITGCFASGSVQARSQTGDSYLHGMIAGQISSTTGSGNTYISSNGVGAGNGLAANFATAQPTSGTTDDGLSWSLGGSYHTELTISGSGAMKNYDTNTILSLWRTTAPWGWHLTKVTVGNGVTSIGNYAFVGNQNLAVINLGSGVTSIGQGAFDRCEAATEITLPASVTTIAYGAFANCKGLVQFNINHDGAVTLGNSNAFEGCDALQYIVFSTPAGALANTASSGNWSGYATKLRVALGSYLFTATGTVDDAAYKIATDDDLRRLATAVNAGNNGTGLTFRQTADIAMSSANFTPIGADSHYFRGTYDGGHHVIDGLTVSTGSQNAGLFGKVEGGTIKDLAVVNPTVSSSYASNGHIGAIVGYCNNSSSYRSRLTNLYTHGTNLAVVGQNDNSSYSTVTNVSHAYIISLGSGITGVSPAATAAENGFVYNNINYYREGLTLALATNLSEQTGYHATYKADNKTLDGNTYTVNSTDGDVTFTAVKEINTYTVQFNGNGGTCGDGEMADQSFTYDVAQNLTANAFTCTGYTFAGWATSDDGDVVYGDKQSVKNLTDTNGATVTLYAKWKANTYTVQFDGNGNTNNGTMTDQSFTYDEAQNLTANTYTRVLTVTYNYNGATGGNSEGSATATATFNGWATSDIGQKVYDDNQSVSNLTDANGATVTLYAKWTDGSVTLPTPTLTGYIFGGWYADSGWNTRLGYAGASYTPSTDITLYAKWTHPDWATESTGTETDPYVIYNNEQLDLLAQRVNSATSDDGAANGYEGKYFELGADIKYSHTTAWDDASSTENNYTAIGCYFGDQDRSFRGHFDGRGHTVSGIRIYKAGSYGADCYQGLFGKSGGSIQGITLADARITGYDNTGGIVGENKGTVSDCHVAATVTINDIQTYTLYHGGIVGENYQGTVSDCTSAATLAKPVNTDGKGYGGIAGFNDGTLRHNLAIGAYVSPDKYSKYGAICGFNDGTLENNYYHACTVASNSVTATGVGCGNADINDNNGAVPAYAMTIGDGVSFLTAVADNLGFRYDSDGDGTPENYCPVGAQFTLIMAGYNNAKYTVIKTADNSDITASVLNGNVLTMPGFDISVSFSGKLIDWANDGHSGTSTDPYMICNKAQLLLLAYRVNGAHGETANDFSGKYFKLGADIAFSYEPNEGNNYAENYEAIGRHDSGTDYYFRGDFDGDGHTVSGIRLRKTGNGNADSYQGLFGLIGDGANVHYVHLADARIKGYENVGGIVGLKSGGTVTGCTVTETAITATANYGTICGNNSNGTLTNNYYRHSTVNGNAYGVGCQGADVTGALPAYALTLGEGVTIQTAMAAGLGFSYDSDGDGTPENYWRKGAQLTLADLPTHIPEGYVISYTVTQTADGTDITGTALNGTTLTVPYADITVTMPLTAIPWSGTGTENDPWVIIYPSQLDLLAQRVNSATGDDDATTGYKGKYFVLGADIAYSTEGIGDTESNYTAIGGYSGGNYRCFRGNFDGRGHTVSGIRIYMGSGSQGLFGQSGGNIRGITLADARITGYIDDKPSLGGIVGANSGTVSDCHVAATVTIRAFLNYLYSYSLGGIVGENTGTVSNCTSAATLTTNEIINAYHGGIAGNNSRGTLSHNLAIGAVVPTADKSYGAICGANSGTLENNYYHACTVAGTANATGMGCGDIWDDNGGFTTADVTDNDGAVPTLRDDADNSTALGLLARLATAGFNGTPLDLGWGAGKYPMQLTGRTLWKDGDWNTLCLPFALSAEQIADSPLSGTTIMELDGAHSDLTNGTLTLNFNTASGMAAGRPYIVKWPLSIAHTISSTDDWHDFAEAVAGGNTYEGKVVRLANNINVSEMVGTSEHKFKGTFDGQGHTLTLNSLSASGEACAPFRYVEGATIANLHTTGTVISDNNTASKYRSGLVGQSDGNTTILNCWSSVTINSSLSDDGTHGGFIGLSNSGNATISNCRFDGSFSGSSTYSWGGFVGWSSSTTTIRNSVFAPAEISIDNTDNATFSRNQVFTKNCYYSQALYNGSDAVTDGATAIGTRSAADLAADLGSGWQVKDGKAVPVITAIYFSDPVFSGVTIDVDLHDVNFSGGSFKGTYQSIAFDKEDQSILFLGAKNTLYYPQKGATIGAFRAYFDLGTAHARQIVLNFGDGSEESGIISISKESGNQGNNPEFLNSLDYYTLDGVKLDGKPTKKGLYIHGGRKVVIK